MRRLARLQKTHLSTSPCSSGIIACSPASRPPTPHSHSTTPSAGYLQRRDLSVASPRFNPPKGRASCALPERNLASREASGAVRPFSTSATVRKQAPTPVTDHDAEEFVEHEEETSESLLPRTDLRVPGQIQAVPASDEVADPTYTPAESADGLEWVGGVEDWWENDRNWGALKKFHGFRRSEKITERAVLEVLARRAVIEALAVRKDAGEGVLTASWRVGGRDQLTAALGVGLEVSAEGQAELRGDSKGLADSLAPTTENETASDEELSLSAEEARELLGSFDPSWKQISIRDPALKFAITKRLQQLTGHVLSDGKIMNALTVSSLLGVLVRPPKPKKLAEEIEANKNLTELPNVKFYPRRVTPIDKEKMAGRWKVIVRELEKRDLPVTGTGGYAKAVEKKWAGERR